MASSSRVSDSERDAMRRALDLALRGWGRVHPNPMVGAVLLRDGVTIGEGYHSEFGGAHAEVNALSAAGSASGATLVVTLEPCCHQGKTPPCTEALIDAGVKRVVIGARDPNPQARGGVERLEEAGVAVVSGVLDQESRALNAPFFFAFEDGSRPFVAAKLAVSMDGFIADCRGSSKWISSETARDYVHWLRAGFDAIGVGRKTAETDDPLLTVRGPIKPRTSPARLIFTRSGAVSEELRLVKTRDQVKTMLVSAGGRIPRTALESVMAADLSGAMRELKARGIGSVLIEGGGELVRALMKEELLDRIYLVQAPIFLGDGVGAFGRGEPRRLDAVERWRVVERTRLGADTLTVLDRR